MEKPGGSVQRTRPARGTVALTIASCPADFNVSETASTGSTPICGVRLKITRSQKVRRNKRADAIVNQDMVWCSFLERQQTEPGRLLACRSSGYCNYIRSKATCRLGKQCLIFLVYNNDDVIDERAIEKCAQRVRQNSFSANLAILLWSFNALACAFSAPRRHDDSSYPHLFVVTLGRQHISPSPRIALPCAKVKG